MTDKLTPTQRLAVACEYAVGIKLKTIASDYGISCTLICKIATAYGVPLRREPGNNRRTAVLEYYRDHPKARVMYIACVLDVSPSWVATVLRSAGIYHRARRKPWTAGPGGRKTATSSASEGQNTSSPRTSGRSSGTASTLSQLPPTTKPANPPRLRSI